ncbi:MAG: hypothetical protein ACK5OX_16685 [Desertimonas sp.]
MLTAVGAGDDGLRSVLERRLATVRDRSAHPRPVAFGVRRVKIGWRRRRVVLVHQGVRVRARFESPEEAVDHLTRLVGDLGTVPPAGMVRVAARVLSDGRRGVLLVASPTTIPPDERPLADAGVVEPPVWQATVDPVHLRVAAGPGVTVPLVGLVVTDAMAGQSLDGSRRHLWANAEGPGLDAWTELLDTRPDLIDRVEPEAMVETVLGRLGRAASADRIEG